MRKKIERALRRWLLLALCLTTCGLLMIFCAAAEVASGGLLYTETEDGLVITGAEQVTAMLTIPAMLDGRPVIAIGEEAFSGYTQLRQVTLPDGLLTIENHAFAGCIGLQTMTLPASLQQISAYAFEGCRAMEDIMVAADSQTLNSQDGVLFTANGKTLLYYPAARPCEDYIIPDGVETIASGAMRGTELVWLTCPASLKTIADHALQNSSMLQELIIPADGALAVIGDYAFTGSSELMILEFPAGLARIGTKAFSGCPIKTVFLGTDTTLGAHAFTPAPDLVLLGRSGSAAAQWAWDNLIRFIDMEKDVVMTGLTAPVSIELHPGQMQKLPLTLKPANTTETRILYSTSDPSVATIDDDGMIAAVQEGVCSVTALGAYGAYTAVTTVYVTPDAGSIPIEVFYLPLPEVLFADVGAMYEVEPVILPPDTTEDTVVTWHSSNDDVVCCADFGFVTLQPGVAVLTASLSNGMSDSVVVVPQDETWLLQCPSSLTEIEAEAFRGTGFTRVRCNDGLQVIGARAFADCTRLMEISIPASVTSIADDAFRNTGEVLLIHCQEGSTAHQYAIKHGFYFSLD